MSIAKLQFDVQLTCSSCANAVQKALEKLDGVHSIEIDVSKQQVVVETSLPYSKVLDTIEGAGFKSVVKGYGSLSGGAAVAEISSDLVKGVVRFVQIDNDKCIIDGVIDGLSGYHGLHIHELGDLSGGCESIGEHYNPSNKLHGGPEDIERHYGDLGNIVANEDGRAVFRKEDSIVKVWDIIGRSLVITADKDDLGKGENERSKIDGNSGKRMACAIIARSAGLFQNPKKFCTCDGISIWDERNMPAAGGTRSQK